MAILEQNFEEIELEEEDYLFIEASKIPNAGNGLFTCIEIHQGEIIARYKGETISTKEAKKREALGVNQYFMTLNTGEIFDALNHFSFAKFANDAKGTQFKNNAIISLNDEDEIILIASKKIKEGEEILTSYGSEYWNTRAV